VLKEMKTAVVAGTLMPEENDTVSNPAVVNTALAYAIWNFVLLNACKRAQREKGKQRKHERACLHKNRRRCGRARAHKQEPHTQQAASHVGWKVEPKARLKKEVSAKEQEGTTCLTAVASLAAVPAAALLSKYALHCAEEALHKSASNRKASHVAIAAKYEQGSVVHGLRGRRRPIVHGELQPVKHKTTDLCEGVAPNNMLSEPPLQRIERGATLLRVGIFERDCQHFAQSARPRWTGKANRRQRDAISSCR
jgi:hypothetical protein